jgi:hypothetical protein
MARRKLQLTSPLLSGPDVRELQKAHQPLRRPPQADRREGGRRRPVRAADRPRDAPRRVSARRRAAITTTAGSGRTRSVIIETPGCAGRSCASGHGSGSRKRASTPTPPTPCCRGSASKVGTTESPANSNRGPEISKWQRDVAGIDGQPWCGAFQGYALKHVAGIVVAGGVVYTPNIISYAKTGTGGFASWHPWKRSASRAT